MTTNRDGRTIDLVLAGAKTALTGIDASPQDTPNVFAMPADRATLTDVRDAFPCIVVRESWSDQFGIKRHFAGRSAYVWTMEILVMLCGAPFANETEALDNEPLADPWPHAISDALYRNRGLGVPGTLVGDTQNGVLLTGRKGIVPFNLTELYFGMRLAVTITQEFVQSAAI